MGPLLQAEGLGFAYDGRTVLDGVDLALRPGEVVGLIGPNGAGKSTLLRLVTGVLRPARGTVLLEGSPVERLGIRALARVVALVPQETPVAFPFTSLEVVLMGRTAHLGHFGFEGPADIAAARRALELTDALPLAGRPVTDLSSGERQRVMLARALAQAPRFLGLDEPAAFLDIRHRLDVYDLLRRLAREEGLAVLEASHDLALAARACDRLVLLVGGRVLADGAPEVVLTPETLAEAFGVRARVERDPVSGSPVVLPDGTVGSYPAL